MTSCLLNGGDMFVQKVSGLDLLGAASMRMAFWTIVWPYVIVFPLFIVNACFVFFPKMIRQILGRCAAPERLPEGVWTIHGRRYDLSAWAKHHPGGSWAIELGRNRDCTGLFESYHVFIDRSKLFKMMERFEIKSDPRSEEEDAATTLFALTLLPNSTGLAFADSFHEDVKQLARDHFDGRSHKMKPWVGCIMAALFGWEVWLGYLCLKGSWVAVVLMPLAGWLLTCNVAHDASHFAVSSRPWVNQLLTCVAMPLVFGPTAWHIQHIVQHHVYTNDDDDVDLYHFLPLLRLSRNSKTVSRFKMQWLLIFFMAPTTVCHLMFVVPCDLLSRQVDAITGTTRYSQCQNRDDLVAGKSVALSCELFLCAFWFALNLYMHGVCNGWCRMILSWGIASYLFLIFTQGAHLQAECMVGKEADSSWAKRQVVTAVNVRPDSYFWLFLTGGLTMQSLHHVLPGIADCHLIDMWPKFKELCAKHDVDVKEVSSIFSFVSGFLSWLAVLAEEYGTAP